MNDNPDRMMASFWPKIATLILVLGFGGGPYAAADDRPGETPELSSAETLKASAVAAIGELVERAIAEGEMPGCVITIGHRGRVVFERAYGHRQIEPEPVAMTVDTVFDLASLTKPIATATSILQLVDQDKLALDQPVAVYWPEFGVQGKEAITVEQLLLHQSGLIADNPLRDYDQGVEEAWRRIAQLKPIHEPGSRFVYSDVNFLVLGHLVERVSGLTLDRFAAERIFGPLDMSETAFCPDDTLRMRTAPTEKRGGVWLRGEVHDPRAARLGGVAGHAGLFSTAGDLARFAKAMAGGGRSGEVTVLTPATWDAMHRPREVGRGQQRGLGWDMRSGYSSNRSDTMSDQAFGHGGFTGTALWIDPQDELFVIFLSNRLHPDGVGSVNRLAGRIGTLAVDACRSP